MATATLYSHIQSVDARSASLIVQLQLDDIGDVISKFKGKGRAGNVVDQEYAFQICREDLEAWQSTLKDQLMGLSILEAQEADREVIQAALREEELAQSDRRLAAQLEGCNLSEPNSSKPNEPAEPGLDADPEYAAKLMAIYHSEEAAASFLEESVDSKAESSARGAQKGSLIPRKANRACEACRDDKKWFDLARVPCRHEYCRDCLDQLFLASVHDESLFPPRCCRQRIPLPSVRVFLSSGTAKSFEQKAPEFETPNRTYCHNKRCSAWIPPGNICNEVGTCPKCATTTCTICKQASHGRNYCPRDEATHEVLELAALNGWQQCYNCGRVVMLSTGCYHMTCRCRAAFCFNCGLRWKTCSCAHFDEHRLLARAEEILIRRQDRRITLWPGDSGPSSEPLNLAEIEKWGILDHLRKYHDCTHERWKFIPGRHQCEECYKHLPQYIFECRGCLTRACNRCRRNRL
ncbi:IBR finger domain protein [Phyllosticta capitalensis]|uniref:RBR-type E3 ubiquitin transferase n=1 Tax=Phyllosticta capitalensis TaxID=121624 RepID=A0ABR1YXV3_9PEZI